MTNRRCPHCMDWTSTAARFCPSCGSRLATMPLPGDALWKRFRIVMAVLLPLAVFVLVIMPILYPRDRAGSSAASTCHLMPNGSCGTMMPGKVVEFDGHYWLIYIDSEGQAWFGGDGRYAGDTRNWRPCNPSR